jgi:hypothetical protein
MKRNQPTHSIGSSGTAMKRSVEVVICASEYSLSPGSIPYLPGVTVD